MCEQHKLWKQISILVFASLGFIQSCFAQESVIAEQVTARQSVVLMPLRVPEKLSNIRGALEDAIVQKLQMKYVVYAGEKVANKARDIFNKESSTLSHKVCDETRCMQDIAMAFQAEMIAVANVINQDGGFFISLSIQNIFDNKLEFSQALPCQGCDAFQVLNIVNKDLMNGNAIVSDDQQETTEWLLVRDSNKIEELNEFIKKYPNGRYIGSAWDRRFQLATASNDARVNLKLCNDFMQDQPDVIHSAVAMDKIWELTTNINDEDTYKDFLKRYPDSKYVPDARKKMASFLPYGIYVGIQAGVTNLTGTFPDAAGSTSRETGGSGWLLGYGNDRFGIELDQVELINNTSDSATSPFYAEPGVLGVVKLNPTYLVGNIRFPIKKNILLMIEAGRHWTNYSYEQNYIQAPTAYPLSGRTSGNVWGIKAQIKIIKWLSLSLGIERFAMGDILKGQVTYKNVGLLFEF